MTAVTCIYFGKQSAAPGACEIYRSNMPLYYLSQRKGWQAQWRWFDEIFSQFRLYGPSAWVKLFAQTDIMLLPRAIAPHPDALRALKAFIDLVHELGKHVVYEVDDDFTGDYRDVGTQGAMDIAGMCDAVTVTTDYLARLMRERSGRPTYVLPNSVAPAPWRWELPYRRVLDPTKITIGLTGSETHKNDWEVLRDVLPQIAEKHENVQVLLGGFHPDYLADMPRTVRHPGVRYEEYAELIKECDIVLAPVLPEDRFNASKSPIKVIEGMAATRMLQGSPAGAACIATHNHVYGQAIVNDLNGLLVDHTPDAWFGAIDRLVSDTPTRQRIQWRGHKWVWKHHNIERTWSLWAAAYDKIRKQPTFSPAPV